MTSLHKNSGRCLSQRRRPRSCPERWPRGPSLAPFVSTAFSSSSPTASLQVDLALRFHLVGRNGMHTARDSIRTGWVWGDHGFLRAMGFVDFAGSSVVHLLGGVAALVSTVLLKPRIHRYSFSISYLYSHIPMKDSTFFLISLKDSIAFMSLPRRKAGQTTSPEPSFYG